MNIYKKLVLALILLMVMAMALPISIMMTSIYALPVVCVGLLLMSAWFILYLFQQQNRQGEMVLKAMINGDTSLGLNKSHPSHQIYQDMRHEMLSARLEAEQQHQFMQALMVHIDIAVLVIDAKGNVINQNPAVNKTLGKKITSLSELAQIGDYIDQTSSSARSTVSWYKAGRLDTFSIRISSATIQSQPLKIVTFQSIHDSLLAKEQHAYKQLSKVLTHEVANSITPLASIAQTCTALIPATNQFDDDEDRQDLLLALQTMESRTQGLGNFIAKFRSISHLPLPDSKPCVIDKIIEQVIVLHQADFDHHNIQLTHDYQYQSLVMLDASQIEQVLINLVKNAIESLQKQHTTSRHISIKVVTTSTGQLFLDVIDTGHGIEPHVQDMIFVPFFTTRQEGSGIGLALSKQIMVNHGGDLVHLSEPGTTHFRCIFS